MTIDTLMYNIEFLIFFCIAISILLFNIFLITKFETNERIIPAIFLLFSIFIYTYLFTFEISISYIIGILFIAMSIYINASKIGSRLN